MEKQIPQLIEVQATKDSHRWVAITALLLAIGVILHTISPNIGGITPNWTIAMYSITIGLTKPSLTRAIGIGFIAGLTIVPSSKSAFPLGNVASEICGAAMACILTKAFLLTQLDKFKFKPFIIGALSTMVSGGVFTFILRLCSRCPFLYGFMLCCLWWLQLAF
jgi:hypothetical protein